MAQKQNEKPPAERQTEGDASASPRNAAEGLPPQSPPQKRAKRSRTPAKIARKKAPDENESPAATAAAAKEQGATGNSAKAKKSAPAKKGPPITPGLRKRVRLAEALRIEGLDERTVAQSYVVVVEKLRDGKVDASSADKVLVDVLKECSRLLEPPRAPGAGTGDTPAVVNLYHNVPRPVRDQRQSGDAESS